MSWSPPRLETEKLCLFDPSNPKPSSPREGPSNFKARSGLPGNWTIFLRGSNEGIGSIGYIRWEREERLGELGFILKHRYRGCGYMTEACKTVMAFGFDSLGLETIEGRSLPHNQASVKLLLRLGMHKTARVQARLFSKGEPVDLDIYQIHKNAAP